MQWEQKSKEVAAMVAVTTVLLFVMVNVFQAIEFIFGDW